MRRSAQFSRSPVSRLTSARSHAAPQWSAVGAQQGGFTLIELLIAMAILAVLSAVAVPIYTSYSESTYRGEAMADLLMCAQGMERYASENFTYVGADDGSGGVLPSVCIPLGEDRYTYSVVTSRTAFTLTATPRAGVMFGDGALEFGSNGQRRWNKDGAGWQNNWKT